MIAEETSRRIVEEARKVIVGQDEVFEFLLISLLSGGHVLLEGVPGTAKTLMAKTLAYTIDASFSRVQFTPDLMPSDVVGTSVFDMATSKFNIRTGPVFTNILLGDEINRAPAKTQSALLEAMEERQVTIEGERRQLPNPFMVIATQNPIEYEGTYPLPEAELDRFFFKVLVGYLPQEQENQVLMAYHSGFDAKEIERAGVQKVVNTEKLAACRAEIAKVDVDQAIMNYITTIAHLSRQSPDLVLGASTRASITLLLAAKAYAAMQGRTFVIPDDVKTLAPAVYRHRIIIKPEVAIEGLTPDDIIRGLLSQTPVPR